MPALTPRSLTPRSLTRPDLQDRLDRMVAEGDMPGAQLAVLVDGAVTTVASGVLNITTGQPATTASLFQVGSIGKLWTATAAMQLVQEGVLDLDEPIRAHLPELSVGDEVTSANVTMRHLLTHTSGIEGDVFDDTGNNDDALARYVELLATLPPVHALGATWSYCNAGFGIAGLLIARQAGTTFEQAIRDRLVVPLGIERFAWNADEAILLGAAVGHVPGPDGQPVVTPTYSFPRNAAPAGLVTITAADLLAFAAAHLDDGGPLLSADLAVAMRTPQVDCPSHLADRWGLGFMIHDWDGTTVVGHGGATIGQFAELYMVPEHDVAVALLVNGSRGRSDHALLSGVLADTCGAALPPIPTPSAGTVTDPARYIGRYSRLGVDLEVALDGDDLVLTRKVHGALADIPGEESMTMPLHPTGEVGRLLARVPGRAVVHAPVILHGVDDERPAYLHMGGRAHVRSDQPT
ncbi:Beta-lactamase [Euzebya pacifica]|uniref:Beta-lactamase n=1 Tax=Euzebya pacifica TaxID=1608957 RepID=A0A346Y5A6_9ACTN|nr:serine hydrolase domain-containing protein [Euzebya pacifica]AXV09653.1 Beta-lactamase [Euzebya pacifica]